jgi:hypothetical protein
MSKEEPSVEQVVDVALAKGTADQLVSYLSRGRRFGKLEETDLTREYVEIMRAWAATPTDPTCRSQISDVTAEYELRRLQPPGDLVSAEWDIIKAAVSRVVEGMSEETKEEIVLDMYTEYEKVKKDQH